MSDQILGGLGTNGKGSRNRVNDTSKFSDNYDQINWSDSASQEKDACNCEVCTCEKEIKNDDNRSEKSTSTEREDSDQGSST